MVNINIYEVSQINVECVCVCVCVCDSFVGQNIKKCAAWFTLISVSSCSSFLPVQLRRRLPNAYSCCTCIPCFGHSLKFSTYQTVEGA